MLMFCLQILRSSHSASIQETADRTDESDDVFRQSKSRHEGCWVCQCHIFTLQGISAFPDGDNLLSWIGTVEGPKESVYEGLTYKLRLEFPAGEIDPSQSWSPRLTIILLGYPYQSPTVKFSTPCFHPNVDSHGNICLDILKEKWSALYEVCIYCTESSMMS